MELLSRHAWVFSIQLLVIGSLIMEIIAIRKITVQNAKLESVRKPPVPVWVPRLFLGAEMAIFLKLTPMVRFCGVHTPGNAHKAFIPLIHAICIPNHTDVECINNYRIYYKQSMARRLVMLR